jgi:hypothetical protein
MLTAIGVFKYFFMEENLYISADILIYMGEENNEPKP